MQIKLNMINQSFFFPTAITASKLNVCIYLSFLPPSSNSPPVLFPLSISRLLHLPLFFSCCHMLFLLVSCWSFCPTLSISFLFFPTSFLLSFPLPSLSLLLSLPLFPPAIPGQQWQCQSGLWKDQAGKGGVSYARRSLGKTRSSHILLMTACCIINQDVHTICKSKTNN